MRNYGHTSVYEFLGDLVVYRNLAPLDPRLPPLAEIRPQVGLPEGLIPRKSQPEYARVMVHLLRRARGLDAPGTPIERLIYVGDTRMNDGAAFANLCRAGGWPGLAFIPEFHPFTADNQDYLAYVCLILGSGLCALGPLVADVRTGRLKNFEQFIIEVDDRATELPTNRRRIHSSVYALVQQGDPTHRSKPSATTSTRPPLNEQ